MTYTITGYDMDHDEILYSTGDLEDAQAAYASICKSYEAGEHDLSDLEDGMTIALEDEDETLLAEETYY